MSVVELGLFFAGDGKFGVNSASLMNFISCLVSVRTKGCVKVSIVSMFLLNSCCLFCLFFFISILLPDAPWIHLQQERRKYISTITCKIRFVEHQAFFF